MKAEERKGAIFVTGASTGIGMAAVIRLDELGYPFFASVRKKQDADTLREASSEKLKPVLMDVTDESSIVRARDEISEPLVHALTAPNPRRVYFAGPGARPAGILTKLMPGSLKDRFIIKSMGLDKL